MQGRNRGDHGGEPGSEKNALGLSDYGKLPAELQQRVHEEVEQARTRSGWSVRRTLAKLEISVSRYYRWLREEAWARALPPEPVPPVQADEAFPEEKEAVRRYALEHPEIRHRELAWRMMDEDVAYVSSSTVYRILKEEQLIGPRRGRRKRYRDEHEKAQYPDPIWGTDIMYFKIGPRQSFFLGFIDE